MFKSKHTLTEWLSVYTILLRTEVYDCHTKGLTRQGGSFFCLCYRQHVKQLQLLGKMPYKIRISNSKMFSIYLIVTVTFLNVYAVEGEWAFKIIH